jgi:hypothetical protein
MSDTTTVLLIIAVLLLAAAELVSIVMAILLLTSLRRLINTWQGVLESGHQVLDKAHDQLIAGAPWLSVMRWGIRKLKK